MTFGPATSEGRLSNDGVAERTKGFLFKRLAGGLTYHPPFENKITRRRPKYGLNLDGLHDEG